MKLIVYTKNKGFLSRLNSHLSEDGSKEKNLAAIVYDIERKVFQVFPLSEGESSLKSKPYEEYKLDDIACTDYGRIFFEEIYKNCKGVRL